MRKKIVKTIKQTCWNLRSLVSSDSIQKRLGYSRVTKLLIIHADDMGISISENDATIQAMNDGMVNSGSVMVPCPGFDEMAKHLSVHTKTDAGLHLTLTSEWPSCKWRPVLPANEVKSLVDQDGLLFPDKKSFLKNVDPDDFEKECRAQIEKALNAGIKLTHIDSHMFMAFANSKFIERYVSLGKEYGLPVLLTQEMPSWVKKTNNSIIVDRLYCARQEDFDRGLSDYYRGVLKNIKPGLNCLLVHVAYDNDEMRQLTLNQKSFGAEWRQTDFDFFTSEECRQLIEKYNIKLITWRELKNKLFI